MRTNLLVVMALCLAAVAAPLGYRAWSVDLAPPEAVAAGAATSADGGGLPGRRALADADPTDFLERPLFARNRRAPPVEESTGQEEPVEEVSAELPDGLTVTGVVRDGDTWFLVGSLGSEPLRLKTGETLKGWTVSGISPDNISFTSGKKVANIKLFEPKPEKAQAKGRPKNLGFVANKRSDRERRRRERDAPGNSENEEKGKDND